MNTNEKKMINLTELLDDELNQVAGDHPFEDCFRDADLHRVCILCQSMEEDPGR